MSRTHARARLHEDRGKFIANPRRRHDGTADGSTGTALKYEEWVLGGCRSRGRHAAIVAYVCTSELARLENKLLEEARLKLQTQRSLI